MNFFPARLLPLFALTSLTAVVAAQDLNAGVTVNPAAGTATYNFQIQGPPNGLALPAVSLRLGPPLQFPGLLGTLDLDPFFLISLPLLPLPLSGFGQGQFTVPLPICNQLPLMMQAVVIDPLHNNQIAFSDAGAACPVVQPANPNMPAVVMVSGVNNGQVTVNFAAGPGGANVMILVNGGQKAQGFLILGPGGQGSTTVPVPGGIQPGDTVTVLVNGVPVSNVIY